MHYRQCTEVLRWSLSMVNVIFFLSVEGWIAPAETAEPVRLTVRPGAHIVLDSASCLKPVVPPVGGAVEVAKVDESRTYAIYRAPTDQNAEVGITIETGLKEKPDKSGCEPASQKHFVVGIDQTPQVSGQALNNSFLILLSAFVMALLLESAFALLFNWRLFQEFLVGNAWRTPIMFAGALLLVRIFDLDLMASLFEAYKPHADGMASKGNWFTSCLTAMILAGGSIGVNRIMVGLGFRSQTRADATEPELDQNEAWIAIRIRKKPSYKRVIHTENFQVNIDEVTPLPGNVPPTTVGFVRPSSFGNRIKELLFPSKSRVPRSGGRRVDTSKFYQITIVDMRPGGKIYDVLGNDIPSISAATVFRFGSRAILDFDVTVPS